MKDTETTEFEKALYARLEEMKEEFKVVKNGLDIEQEVNKNNHESIKKLKDQVQSLQKDLELERPRYGADSTRKIARDAFNQSTTEANWISLENHPVIKNLYASITIARRDLSQANEALTRRVNDVQPANEVFEELRNTDVITTIMARLADADSFAQTLGNDVDNDRRHGNQQDLKLRDKLADLETCQNGFAFLLSETNDMFMNGMIFSIGAFATMGYEKVGEGIREIIKKPKEKKNDGKTQG